MTPGGTRSAATAVLAPALAVVAGLGLAASGGAFTRPDAETTISAAALTNRQLAGQRLVCAFDGTSAPAGLKKMISRGELAGVILFSQNVSSRSQVRRLARSLQAVKRPPGLHPPVLVMTDQEGGLVKRFSGPPAYSAAQMGTMGAALAKSQGTATAKSLTGVGVNVDLAPVLDVGRPGGFIRAQDRSFSGKPRRVADVGVAFARGLQNHGVAATAKHFPGLGAATGNTDLRATAIRLSKKTIRGVDEVPFRAFGDAGGGLVMLDSAGYPAFGSGKRPAVLTKAIATGELRGRLGFRGVTVTDALETPAALSVAGPVATGVLAVKSGADLLLYSRGCGTAVRVAEALRRKLAAHELDRGHFEASVDRVIELRRGLR